MPEYRRFIAYFYEYIDGKKQKNTGFAKVELRNGTWRILFRLTAPVHPRPPVEVFGFVREGDHLMGLPMGNMRPGREMMEEWAYHDETLWMGKYGLSDFSGIWIRSGDGRHFITVWDEEPVDVERFVTELPENNERTFRKHAEIPETESTESMREDGGLKETETESAVDTGASAESRPKHAADHEAVSSGILERMDGGSPAEMTAQDEIVLLGNEQTENRTGECQNAGGFCETEQEAETEQKIEMELQADRSEAMLLKKQDTGKESVEPDQAEENRKMWQKLYEKSSSFHPFSDQEISACIRVDPDDILQLQRARWHTGRNSFLMHGYYNYRHLMIGKTEEGKYVLGVPGIMNPQEKYLAVMFGFPNFKFSDEPEQNPAGGYWYRILEQGLPETSF